MVDQFERTIFTTGQAAEYLGVSRSYVIHLCDLWLPDDDDGLFCYRVGSHRRIPLYELKRYKLRMLSN